MILSPRNTPNTRKRNIHSAMAFQNSQEVKNMQTPTRVNSTPYDSIRQIVSTARQNAYRAINFAMVEAYGTSLG